MGSNVEKCLPAQLDSTGQSYRIEQEQHSFYNWRSKWLFKTNSFAPRGLKEGGGNPAPLSILVLKKKIWG